MSLRTRLAVLTSAAVALAIVAASVAAWFLIRSSLLDEVDRSLLERVPNVDMIAEMTVRERPSTGELVAGEARMVLQTEPIGVQLVDDQGDVVRSLAPGDVAIQLDPDEQQLLVGGEGVAPLRTVTIDGESYRVLSVGVVSDEGGLLRLIQPLAGVEETMTRIAWMLVGVSGVGVAVAGGLGFATARAGLRPVDRLADAAERVAETGDLAHRIDVKADDNDEVARLASSVNAMLTALDEAQAQQRELVENASHELRTPLATLRNDVGLLLSAEQRPDRQLSEADRAQVLGDLETEAEALSELVAEVVDLARGDIEPEPFLETNLRGVVDRAVTRTSRIDESVDARVSGPDLEVSARPAALQRAVSNLVRNAIQVSPSGGTVDVTLSEEGDQAVVRVMDCGPGIDEADLPRIFDRFYRGAGARKRHGSGLGLAIVSQVAAMHDGTVAAENRPGGGAVFTLRLPVGPSGDS